MTEVEDETHCLYCDRDYGTLNKLKRHLQGMHAGTYGQLKIAPFKSTESTEISTTEEIYSE